MDRDIDSWRLLVDPTDAAVATVELDAYAAEREIPPPSDVARSGGGGGAVAGVIGYAGVLIAIAAASFQPGSHSIWAAAGGMSVGHVWAGQWWRPVTALTLHADAGHLLSNLAFGGFYGLLAGRVLGGGVAWLSIVIAGSLGNAATALFRGAEHASIGASTAVFAILGMLVADGLRPVAREARLFKRMAPLIIGVVVFSMTGLGGERTDVGAHVAGFVVGLPTGWLIGRWPAAGPAPQRFAGAAGLAIVTAAWGWAIVQAATGSAD